MYAYYDQKLYLAKKRKKSKMIKSKMIKNKI